MYIQVLNMMKQTGPVTIPPSPPFPSTFFRFRKLEKSKKWITTRASTGQSALFSCVYVSVLSFGQEQVRYRSDYFRQKSLATHTHRHILKRGRNKQNPAGKTKSEGRKEGKCLTVKLARANPATAVMPGTPVELLHTQVTRNEPVAST
jgi:hypothetical protein